MMTIQKSLSSNFKIKPHKLYTSIKNTLNINQIKTNKIFSSLNTPHLIGTILNFIDQKIENS